MDVGCRQRGLCGAQGGRGRWKEGKRLPQRDDTMSRCAELRRAHVQWIERRKLEVQDARRDAHVEKISSARVILRAMTVEAPALMARPRSRYDRQFYVGMAIVAAVAVVIGFAPTYFLRASYQSTSLPLYLRIHGFLFTTWIALFIAQTSLVAARRTDIHRRLGWATVALAVIMVIAGTTAGILSGRREVAAGHVDEALSFLTTPLFSMVVFPAFVAAAIRFRRQPQTHKRLMLLATISLLDAPVARLPFEILQASSWAYMVATDLFLLPVILYDVISRRQVSPVYLWGGSLLIVEQLLRIPIGETDAWHTIARAILF
jgi:hypothetical protein